MRPGKRLSLPEIVELGIRSVCKEEDALEQLLKKKVQVILISHNITAEWSVLADRDESYITRRLALVRKSPITDGNNIKITINPRLPVGVKFFDTMLLAPASHRSLKKLSVLLGSDDKEKEEISHYYIANMDQYLRDEPELFEKYALKDSEITLALFFVIQTAINKLSKQSFRLFRTLASAGVGSFLEENEWFKKYRKDLLEHHKEYYQLISRSYYGGRNEGYFIGSTNDYPETKNKLWIDIDFTGCYPTAMALSPKIDVEKEADYIPRQYKLDDHDIEALKKDNISPETLKTVREALSISQEEFDLALMDLPKKTSWAIREKASVVDNRLINKWHKRWKTGDTTIEQVLTPGFARIRFKFPKDTQFPCLPVRHKEYGLLYTMKGETVVPAAEIILALEMGAILEALTSLELPIVKDENGTPDRYVMEPLSELTKARVSYQGKKDAKSELMQALVKEFTNSFYGKFSQSINARKVFNPSTNEKVYLGKSTITEPCMASLVTSLPRAALSAILNGVDQFNKGKSLYDQITVISATTDGLLIGIPVPEGFSSADKENKFYDIVDGKPKFRKKKIKRELPAILKRFGCLEMLTEVEKTLPIKQLMYSRTKLTGSADYLEIKHIVDEVISIKTRGQIGLLNSGEAMLLAKGNLKPPLSEIIEDKEDYKQIMDTGGVERNSIEADWILSHLDTDEIKSYPFITLNSFINISKSNGTIDLTSKMRDQKINTDFDWKRKIVWDDEYTISPYTKPHQDYTTMVQCRSIVRAIRRTGKVAKPEKVLQQLKIKGKITRSVGGEAIEATRMLLRGVRQGHIPIKENLPPLQAIAGEINIIWKTMGLSKIHSKVWSENDLKSARRGTWEPGCIYQDQNIEDLIAKLAVTLGVDPDVAKKTIFNVEEFKEENLNRIGYVITAIAKAPSMGIEPFATLHQQGLLPTRQTILDTFKNQIPVQQLKQCFHETFIPGKLQSYHAKGLQKLFYYLGIPKNHCLKCARSLAPPTRERKYKRNPTERKCADQFVMAIQQSDIRNRDMKVYEVVNKLKKFGITKNKYYELKKGIFTPNSLENTQQNEQQIKRMAIACSHDPVLFQKLILSK